MTPDDPFGRKGEDRTDAFGRPIDEEQQPASSLWSGQADAERIAPEEPAQQAEPAAPAGPPRFRPPTDAPPEQAAWWSADDRSLSSPSASSRASEDLASYGERAGAAAIDFFIRAVIVIVVTLAFATSGSEDATAGGLLIAIYLIAPLYAPLAMSRWEGQTVGHKAVNTRIVTRGGAPVRGGKAFTREFLVKNVLIEGLGGLITLGILTLVNYLWPLWDDRNEALHDKMCDTRVVKAQSAP